MPALGADMEAGTLTEWHVKIGDRVRSGDVVAVVETQKGAIEVEIFLGGVVSKLLVGEGERVPVGAVLAEINGAGAAAPPARPEAAAQTSPLAAARLAPKAEAPISPPAAGPAQPIAPSGARLRVTPAARSMRQRCMSISSP